MESAADKSPTAWLPLTPSGVAAFARASFARLWLVQFIVASLTAGTVVWVLANDWFPVISAAVDHLPQEGAIRGGRLEWGGNGSQLLAHSHFLAFVVDLDHGGEIRSPSQIQFEFGRNDLRVYSVFGLAELKYPVQYSVPFNLQELKPWWGAWSPILLGVAALSVVGGLFVSWAVLSTVYCVVVWLTGFYLNRDLTWRGSWLIAGAGLMPGALVITAAIGWYGLAKLDLVRLTAAWAFHFVLAWVYLFLGARAAPKLVESTAERQNPFKPSEASEPGKSAEKTES